MTEIQVYSFTSIGDVIGPEPLVEQLRLHGCSSGLGHTQQEGSGGVRVLITLEVNVLGLHFLLLPHTVPAQLFTLQGQHQLKLLTMVWTQKVGGLASQATCQFWS